VYDKFQLFFLKITGIINPIDTDASIRFEGVSTYYSTNVGFDFIVGVLQQTVTLPSTTFKAGTIT
jgi:hypothetical protein